MAARAVLKITIQHEAPGRYPIVAELSSPNGLERRAEGLWEYERVDLLGLLQPHAYGTLLGRGVFAGAVARLLAHAIGEFEGVHVLLAIEADELRALRWERLCGPFDGDRWDFLARNPQTPLAIHLATDVDRRFAPFGRRDLRALVLVASPPGLGDYKFEPFDAAAALRTVQDGLGDIPYDCLWDGPDAVGRPTLRALVERLTTTRYTLLHLVCHGVFAGQRRAAADGPAPLTSGETAILIEGDDGRVDRVETARLVAQLHAVDQLPHFAFLATCESADPRAEGALGSLAHRLVRELGVPAVVAMTEKISQTTALELGRAFYPRLREHGEVDRALVESLASVGERFDVAVPALFSRLGGRPLFSDDAGRPATANELMLALRDLEALLSVRAPICRPSLDELAVKLREMIDPRGLSRERRLERDALLRGLDELCEEILDIPFSELARGAAPPAYDPTCPFRGLQAFKPDEHRFFFGRDEPLAHLERALQAAPFLAVLGPSGSGKSSLVLAGLIPRLRRSRPDLKFISMVPSSRPMIRLERALAGADLDDALRRAEALRARRHGPLLADEPPASPLSAVLVVDQLEEVFTHCDGADERAEFFELLLALTRDLLVVVTLRVDFLDDIAAHPELQRALDRHRFTLAPMTPQELQAAIERQAAAVGLRLDRDLTATLLEHVASEPGAMPLVQHTLLELWRRRHGRWLRSDEYRALGEVSGAIATTAEAIYADQKDPADKDRVRRIFLRLTLVDVDAAPGVERRDRRRRVAIVELVPAGEPPEPTRRLIDVLVDHRLLVAAVSPQTGRETVEVSHEALIRRWPRLQGWIAEDLEPLRKLYAVQDAARAWDDAGRRPDALAFTDARVADIEALTARFPLNQLEADYHRACVDAREAARARELDDARKALEAAHDRAREQARQARRLRKRSTIIAALGLLSLASAIASTFLYFRAEQAKVQLAEQRQVVAAATQRAAEDEVHARDAARIATIARLGTDSTRKALVLREVESLGDDPLWGQHLTIIANELRATSGFDRPSPFGKQSPPPGRTGLALDAAGERLLALGRAGDLSFRSVTGPDQLWTAAPAAGEPPPADTLVPSPLGDGAFVLGRAPGFQAALDVRSPQVAIPLAELFDVAAHDGRPRALARLAGDAPCDLALVDVDVRAGTTRTRCLLEGQPDLDRALLLPVADAALAVTDRGDATILPLSGGPAHARLDAPRRSAGRPRPGKRAVLSVARNLDGSRVLLVTADQVAVWSVTPSAQPSLLPGSTHAFGDHARLWGALVDGDTPFVVDEGGLVWALDDGAWNITGSFESAPSRRSTQPFVHGVAAHALAVGTGSKLSVFDLVARRLRTIHGHVTTVTEVAFSADGRRLASAGLEAVRVWDLDQQLGVMRWFGPWQGPLRLLDISADGRAALVGAGGAALLGRLDGRRALEVIAGRDVLDARFLPDGIAVAVRTAAGAGVWLPAGGLRAAAADRPWDPADAFSDPTRVFVDRDVLWGIRDDGRAFVTRPPGGPISGGAFARGGRHLLVWHRRDEDHPLDRAALVTPDGPVVELLAADGPLARLAVDQLVWSPDGSRLLATVTEEGRACALHWPPGRPAAARRTCVDEIPGATASPDPRGRFGLRGAAWSADATRIALVLGDGNVLLDAVGDAPPQWFETWSERWERTALQFGPRSEHLVETTGSGVYIWPLGQRTATPITLVDFDTSDPPAALAAVPLDGGRGLLTVSLRDLDRGMTLAVRRWRLDPDDAEAALTTDSPFCLEPAWRRANLHEEPDLARRRYCECRAKLRLPDRTCG